MIFSNYQVLEQINIDDEKLRIAQMPPKNLFNEERYREKLKNSIVAGWGSSSDVETEPFSPVLRWLTVEAISIESCNELLDNNPIIERTDAICGLQNFGSGICMVINLCSKRSFDGM